MSDVFARGARRQVAEDFSRLFDREAQRARACRAARAPRPPRLPRLQLHGRVGPRAALRDGPARGARPRHGRPRGRGGRPGLREGRDHARGRAHARLPAQLPLLDASTRLKQIQDPEFTKKNGLTGSVMDYTPFNISLKGEKQGEYVMSTLGPYDYWAIEYAYKEIDAGRGEGGARPHRLALDRAAARLRQRRGRRLRQHRDRHRPGGQPLRPRRRPAGLLPQAPEALARALGPPAGRCSSPRARATSGSRAASPPASHQLTRVAPARGQVRGRRAPPARPRRAPAAPLYEPTPGGEAARGARA